jgi:cytochrome b subunit of formate dehydrogenase
LEKNLIDVSDIQRKANKVILDKKNLVALIVSRGLHSLTGLSPSMMITSVVQSFEEGIHYTQSQENRYNRPNRSRAIVLTNE